jgi:hypothetical protein
MEPVFENVTKDIMEVMQPLETYPSHPSAKKKQKLHENGEFRHKGDENTKFYKGRTTTDHDKNHTKRSFMWDRKCGPINQD